ncbi:MAG: PAS domain S-box protein [Methanomassiliicoccales archaeon]|nr:PAS domain S-box protein [Methanomassiliicoccales archaeon]
MYNSDAKRLMDNVMRLLRRLMSSLSILYIDDEPALLDLCKEYLGELDEIDVDTATGAMPAMKKMNARKYDAVVSDYQMPGMDGIALLKMIRANNDNTPFILFTGKGREEVAIEALNSGADAYLQKSGESSSLFIELAHWVRQIAAKHNAEEAIKRNEVRFRSFVEGAHAAIVLTKGNTIEYANPRAISMFGYDRDDHLVGKPIADIVAPQERENVNSYISQRLDDRSSFDAELMAIRKDGTQFPIHLSLSEVWTSEDPDVSLLSIITDLSERQRMEKAIQLSEKKYRVIFNEAPIGITTLNTEGQALDFNDELPKMLGYRRAELINIPFTAITHKDDLPNNLRLFNDLVEGKIDRYDLEKRYIRKDGSIMWARVIVNLVEILEKDPPLVLAVIVDITKRKEAELRDAHE